MALTFDPRISGLEKSLAFPLLISNATTFLLNQADAPAAVTEQFDPVESDIAPWPIPSFSSSVVPVVAADGANAHPELAEQWPWLLAGVLIVLGAEWLIFARRG